MTEKIAQLKPETMKADDWLKAVHDIDPFHRPVGFVSNLCKNLILNQEKEKDIEANLR